MNRVIFLCLFFCWGLLPLSAQNNLPGATNEGQIRYKTLRFQDESYLQKMAILNRRLAQYKVAKNKPLIQQTEESLKQLEVNRSEQLYAKTVRENKDSALTIYAMSIYGAININTYPRKVESLLNTLSNSMQQQEQFVKLRHLIALNKTLMVGQPAPVFSQADTSGNLLALTALRGQYVLIDFWASWCKPCRAQSPMLLKIFEKYKNKGFTILGVSLDNNKRLWTEAIRQDKSDWHHVSDLRSWNNAVAALYNISSVPQNYLLDREGVIIGKNLNEDELEALLRKI